MAQFFELSEQQAVAQVRRVARAVAGWQAHFAGCGVTQHDIASLAEQLDRPFLAEQRREYE